jgi:hypothetical protein
MLSPDDASRAVRVAALLFRSGVDLEFGSAILIGQ